MTNDLSARVIEVYFFYKTWSSGEIEQSPEYNTLEEALQARDSALRDFAEVSPIVKGYI